MGLKYNKRTTRRLRRPGSLLHMSTWLYQQALSSITSAQPRASVALGHLRESGSVSIIVRHWEITVHTRQGRDLLQEAFGNIFQEKKTEMGWKMKIKLYHGQKHFNTRIHGPYLHRSLPSLKLI